MPRKGRPPSGIACRSLELYLPRALLDEVELYLPRDALTCKVKHGAWSTYVSQLMREDLERKAQRKEQKNVSN